MEINGRKFTLGADPELFIAQGGEVASAFGLIEGTKEQPSPVEGGAVQVDGMALEFNIDPVEDKDMFLSRINSVQRQLLDMVGDYEVYPHTTANFTEEFLGTQPFEAVQLGCDPDYNAYTRGVNPSPNSSLPMRTAGGHVHIGGFETDNIFNPKHIARCRAITKALDYYLGLPSLLWDKDTKRREMYGQSGAFRPKTYGVEYRTLSNAWIFNENLIKFVYDGVERALSDVMNGKFIPENPTFPALTELNGYSWGRVDPDGHIRGEFPL